MKTIFPHSSDGLAVMYDASLVGSVTGSFMGDVRGNINIDFSGGWFGYGSKGGIGPVYHPLIQIPLNFGHQMKDINLKLPGHHIGHDGYSEYFNTWENLEMLKS